MAKVSRPRVVAKQHLADVDMPETVTLSLADLARSAKEHLLSLSVAAGLLTLQELLEAELTRLVGAKGKHRADRTAYRHGSERRSVTLGGGLVEIQRPRARSRDGRELALATYAAVAERDLLTEAALARMLAGLSARHYPDGLEPIGEDVPVRGTSRSAVSRRFVKGTAAKLAQLHSRDLTKLGLLALFIEGIEIGGHTIVVALGVRRHGPQAHAGALGGVREGLEETLTISRLSLSPALIKTFKSTNPIESLNDGIRTIERNVKNWQSGRMAERWTAAAVIEREKRFRRINGCRDLWILERALDRHTKEVASSRIAA